MILILILQDSLISQIRKRKCNIPSIWPWASGSTWRMSEWMIQDKTHFITDLTDYLQILPPREEAVGKTGGIIMKYSFPVTSAEVPSLTLRLKVTPQIQQPCDSWQVGAKTREAMQVLGLNITLSVDGSLRGPLLATGKAFAQAS